ncbi:conserved hypothetical protein [Tenacibaculum sp. 190524A02b]|uniref:Uncharacterized protein n=1 Tax=Tenacibaculum vairaonense TaxID=3137860 RepID=A0ABM9PLQ5_9FLAO
MRLIVILLYITLLLSCKKEKETGFIQKNVHNSFSWIYKPDTLFASNKIFLSAKTNIPKNNLLLFISNDYGNSIIKPIVNGETATFNLPKSFSNISGFLTYSLVSNKTILEKGNLIIKPLNKTNLLETYCGPPYLVASEDDFAMLVVIPMDIYDNPNKNDYYSVETYRNKSTKKLIKHNELLAHNNIYSRIKKGKLFTQAYTDSIQSKLLEITVLSNNPTNFSIDFDRNTSLADGKELTTLKTSIIKDQYNNIIENGTLVSFYLTFGNTHMKAYGKTNNGIAISQFVHPSKKRTYTVQAFVEGFASSNKLTITYN